MLLYKYVYYSKPNLSDKIASHVYISFIAVFCCDILRIRTTESMSPCGARPSPPDGAPRSRDLSIHGPLWGPTRQVNHFILDGPLSIHGPLWGPDLFRT